MDQEIDFKKLRSDLKENYGTAMFAGFGASIIELSEIENASEEELHRIAAKEKINLRKYKK